MNSDQIQHILERLIKPSSCKFLGVFASNLIPNIVTIKSFPACFVVNTDDSDSPGEHWLAFYYENADYIEYFDSFGLSIDIYNIAIAPSISNTRRLQSFDSSVCAHYCIYYLYHRSLGHSFVNIIRNFDVSNYNWNDHQVAHFIHKCFSLRNSVINKRSFNSSCTICQTSTSAFRCKFCSNLYHH